MFSLNCDFNWNLSLTFFIFIFIYSLGNVNIKIFHNDDWTMFKRLLNYSLKMFMNVEIEHE